MSIKLTFSSPDHISQEALRKPEVEKIQRKIQEVQNTINFQVKKVFEKLLEEGPQPGIWKGLRSPEEVISNDEGNQLIWTDVRNRPIETTPEEYELYKLLQSLHAALEQVETLKKTHDEKRQSADSARQRLSRITSALKTKGLDIKPEELTEDGFQARVEQQAPEQDQEAWKAPVQGIWKQHKEHIPEYQERIREATQLPTKQELEKAFQMEKETQEQLKKLLKRLSEKPEMYSETIGDVLFLLKKYITALLKKLMDLGVPLPSTPSEWNHLQNLLKEKISYTIEQPVENDHSTETPVNYNRRAKWFLVSMLGALATLLAVSPSKNTTLPQPSPAPSTSPATPEPTANSTPTVALNLLYPQLGDARAAEANLDLRTTDLPSEELIGELNGYLKNGLRKVMEWQPLREQNGNIMLFYPDAENTVEDFLKSFPQLTKVNPEYLRVLSLVCTDGTKRRDGKEILFDACFELIVGDKRYLLVKDVKAQSEIPQDRFIIPYKIFELKADGQLDLALLVGRNEHINPHLLQISGKIYDKSISAQASLRPGLIDETSEIVGVISGILMMNR